MSHSTSDPGFEAAAGVTDLLSAIERGDAGVTDDLLPRVYQELRRLAARRLAHEKPGQTLQPTALVHEAWLRLVDGPARQQWDSRRHFFAAAAEAMRRILVDNARRKQSLKRGGELERQPLDESAVAAPDAPDELLAVHEALDRLSTSDPQAAELVKLRYFSGLTAAEAADVLSISPRTADRLWAYARAWLLRELQS